MTVAPLSFCSYIVFPGVGALSCRPRSSGVGHPTYRRNAVPHCFIFPWGAAAAQDRPANQKQGWGSPSHVQRCTDLHFLRSGNDGAVELPNDGVCRPANGDELCQWRSDERHPRTNHHSGFHPLPFSAVGALCPHHGNEDSHHSYDDGDDGESPGSLQVLRESQHWVVDFTLHLSRTLEHTAHPQTLPVHLSCDDVGANESSDPPHR